MSHLKWWILILGIFGASAICASAQSNGKSKVSEVQGPDPKVLLQLLKSSISPRSKLEILREIGNSGIQDDALSQGIEEIAVHDPNEIVRSAAMQLVEVTRPLDLGPDASQPIRQTEQSAKKFELDDEGGLAVEPPEESQANPPPVDSHRGQVAAAQTLFGDDPEGARLCGIIRSGVIPKDPKFYLEMLDALMRDNDFVGCYQIPMMMNRANPHFKEVQNRLYHLWAIHDEWENSTRPKFHPFEVKLALAQMIGHLFPRDHRSVEALLEMVHDDGEGHNGMASRYALLELGKIAKDDPDFREIYHLDKVFESATHDSREYVRRGAYEALGEAGSISPNELNEIVKTVTGKEKETDYNARIEAIKTLAKSVQKDSPQKAVLYDVFKDPKVSSLVKFDVFDDLVALRDPDPRTARSLRDFAKSQNRAVRKLLEKKIADSTGGIAKRFLSCVVNAVRSGVHSGRTLKN